MAKPHPIYRHPPWQFDTPAASGSTIEMSFPFHPIQVIVALLAEWVRREQEKVIEFLESETKILREQLGDRRILLDDNERRLLAVKGMALSKEDLERACVIVQPETLRRWHRELVEGNRYTNTKRKTGRPSTDEEIVELVLRMARENVSWGYKRIEGALQNVGYTISSSTVANILKHHGIEPAPQRQRQLSWSTFLKAHRDAFEGLDFLAIFGVFSWLSTLRDHIRDFWFETEGPIDGVLQVPAGDAVIYRFPEPENVEKQAVPCETASIELRQLTRGPPHTRDDLTSPPSNILAKTA